MAQNIKGQYKNFDAVEIARPIKEAEPSGRWVSQLDVALVRAGAAALLKTLKEQGFRLNGTPNDELVLSALKARGTKKGWLVIIEEG